MADARLLMDAAAGLLAAALFVYVGVRNAGRDATDGPSRLALRQFAAWWFGLAAYTLVGAARSALAAAGQLDLGLHVALEILGYAPLCVALWGLLSYLVFIYAGTQRWQPFIVGYHVVLGVGLSLLLFRTQPRAVAAEAWRTQLVDAHPLEGAPLVLVVLAILGPVMLGAIGYAALYPRTRDRQVRRRIALVSGALLLWFGLSAFGASAQAGWEGWPLVARALGLGATLLLILAFRDGRPVDRGLAA